MLDGKLVLVTGASRGIGKAIALTLGGAGATVIGTATTETGAENISKVFAENKISGKGNKLDVTDNGQISSLINSVNEEFGPIDILINNAGITKDNIFPRLKQEDWDSVIDTNLTGSFRASQRAIKGMMKNKWGRIIFISAVAGISGNTGQSNYAASKAGLIGLAKTISKELGSRNITSNVIAPGYIETDMTSFLNDEQKEDIIEQLSIKRVGKPEDIANMVSFLCSDESEYITGQVFPVDGGLTT